MRGVVIVTTGGREGTVRQQLGAVNLDHVTVVRFHKDQRIIDAGVGSTVKLWLACGSQIVIQGELGDWVKTE